MKFIEDDGERKEIIDKEQEWKKFSLPLDRSILIRIVTWLNISKISNDAFQLSELQITLCHD
jgi:hypothetical protein